MGRDVSVGGRIALAVLALGLAACSGGPDPASRPGPATTPAAPAGSPGPVTGVLRLDHDPLVRQVLAISVDGLSPQALAELGPTGAPGFERLRRESAATLNARTEYELTVTLPNHAGMLTGRRVDPARGGHGVVVNDDRAASTVQAAAGERVASVFDVVHRAGGTTALFTSKEKFALFDRSWPAIDRFTVDLDNAALVRRTVADLDASGRTFTFLHLSAPDLAGHADGWMSPSYLDAVREVDRLLGLLLDAVDRSPGAGSTAVVLTADHGGEGLGHTDPEAAADYTVPFYVRAPGVPGGADLYDLNPQRRDPGTGRPAYGGRQPVRNGDLANLVTDLLGLAPVPGSTLDARQDLEVVP